MGTTARIVQTCQESIKQLTDRIQEERKERIERVINNEVLEEYKKMTQMYQTHLHKIEEQLTIANKIREERNNLFKDFLNKQNDN